MEPLTTPPPVCVGWIIDGFRCLHAEQLHQAGLIGGPWRRVGASWIPEEPDQPLTHAVLEMVLSPSPRLLIGMLDSVSGRISPAHRLALDVIISPSPPRLCCPACGHGAQVVSLMDQEATGCDRCLPQFPPPGRSARRWAIIRGPGAQEVAWGSDRIRRDARGQHDDNHT